MKRYLKGYRRVTRTIANPKYDERRHIGIASIKQFTKGTVLTHFEYTWPDRSGHSLHELQFGEDGGYSCLCQSDSLWQQLPPLDQWTEETEPSLWQRYRDDCGNEDRFVLRRILEKDLVTWEQVLEIWNEKKKV